jgi:GNAT superfamily N-acetyltransferase
VRSHPNEQDQVTTARGELIELGPLSPPETEDLFMMFSAIVSSGDGYPHRPPLTRAGFEETWVHPVSIVIGARLDDSLAGAYYLKPNFLGKAAHIANAGYVVAPEARRRGVARALVEDSIWRAPMVGFDAIQFNLVFASNPARPLYEELGWQVTGRVPEAVDGEDAIIYWRKV